MDPVLVPRLRGSCLARSNGTHERNLAFPRSPALRSLAALGALDRVKDLEKWQFRVRKASAAGETKQPGWEEIEAWVCQQRFERFLHARKDNPQSPARSLLEP